MSSSQASRIDMATALEISISDPLIEQKINALKLLHAKKIKSLMGSIDALNKEITKMKTLTKDNRRTQMIQILKKQIRDLESVIDVLKEELSKATSQSATEISDMIIKKTIDGPKRFRPKTREEMELQITDLERKVKKLENRPITTDVTASKSVVSTAPPAARASTTSLNKPQCQTSGTPASIPPLQNNQNNNTNNNNNNTNNTADNRNKIALLSEDIQTLHKELSNKEDILCQMKEENNRLRSRNAELRQYQEVYIV